MISFLGFFFSLFFPALLAQVGPTPAPSLPPLASPAPSDVVFGVHGGTLGVTSLFPVSSLSNAPCGSKAFVVTCSPYNATGNGTTDDSAAIQAAITAAEATGSTVYFFPGFTYLIDTGLVDTGAPLACLGGAFSNVTPLLYPQCRILWGGSSGGIMLTVLPPGSARVVDRVGLFNMAFDGNANLAGGCVNFGGTNSQIVDLSVTNCGATTTSYGLFLGAGASGLSLHNHVLSFYCDMKSGGDCLHMGRYASALSTSQNEINGANMVYGALGRGLVFDSVDESRATVIQAVPYGGVTTTLSTAFTLTTSPQSITVANSAIFLPNTAASISSVTPSQTQYVSISAITDSTHITVAWSNGTGPGQTFPVGSTLYEVNDGVSFLPGSFNNVVDVCILCFVHAANQSTAFGGSPPNNTVLNLDYGDNHPPAPTVEPSARLTYSLDFGPSYNNSNVNQILCDNVTTCNSIIYGLGAPAPAKAATTSAFVGNAANDHMRFFDYTTGATAGFGYGTSVTPQTTVTGTFSFGAPLKAFGCVTPGNGSAFGTAVACGGTGAPAFSAPNGSTYMRYDGGTGTRFYINTSGASTSGTTWTAQF